MYQFREVTLRNQALEKKVLVIEFTDPDKAIIGEYLMTDASLMKYRVLETIDAVLAGEKRCERVSGNRYGLVIRPETTVIDDEFVGLFDEFATYPAHELPTTELRDLIVMWRDKVTAFTAEN